MPGIDPGWVVSNPEGDRQLTTCGPDGFFPDRSCSDVFYRNIYKLDVDNGHSWKRFLLAIRRRG